MTDNFFSYVAWAKLKKDGERVFFSSFGKNGDTVHHYLKKMIYILEKFPKVKTEVPYRVYYRFRYNKETYFNINLFSNGNSTISEKGGVNLEDQSKKEEILKYFLNRFYHINIEKLIKDILKFPENKDLPQNLLLRPEQINELLAIFQKELLKGKTEKKIVTIRNSKLLKNFKQVPIDIIKKTLIDMFPFPDNQILIDSDCFAQNKNVICDKRKSKVNSRKNS